jgi:release factor glutamine methyltransferase
MDIKQEIPYCYDNGDSSMKVSKCLRELKNEFPLIKEDDIKYFIVELMGLQSLELFLHYEEDIREDKYLQIKDMLNRRSAGEPLQYIMGKAYFRSYEIKVGNGVLIPRPETEILVDECLDILKGRGDTKVCDMGTGSGAIAISIASEQPNAEVFAVDISATALKYALENINRYKLNERIRLIQSNLFENFKNIQCDVIAANLPYVAYNFLPSMDKEVKSYEPHLALFAEDAGLKIIKECAEEGYAFLVSGGSIIFEISPEQEVKCLEILKSLNYKNIRSINDLTGRARFCAGVAK